MALCVGLCSLQIWSVLFKNRVLGLCLLLGGGNDKRVSRFV